MNKEVVNFDKARYFALKAKKDSVQREIDILFKEDAQKYSDEIGALIDKRIKFQRAIFKLLNSDTKAFENYAKSLFDIITNTILHDINLSVDALNFAELSVERKQRFGQSLINAIIKYYGIKTEVTHIKFDYLPDNQGAAYDYTTHDILINTADRVKLKNLEYYVGILLHEFTHYLYDIYPEHSPVGKQKAIAAKENRIFAAPTKSSLLLYKQSSFEYPAYFVQTYFKKHRFKQYITTAVYQKNEMLEKR